MTEFLQWLDAKYPQVSKVDLRVESPLAKPKLVIDGRVPSTLRVSPTSSLVAFNNDKEDQDNYALFLWDGKSEARKLSSFSGKDDSVDSFIWERDGKSIYYTLNDYETKLTKLCHSECEQVLLFGPERPLECNRRRPRQG